MAVGKHTPEKPPISLKQLAEHLNLSPATISLVVNSAPGMRTIALATRARVLAAAKELNYRPNSLARSLRTRQTFTIGVIAPELSEGYFTLVMNAVEAYFLQAGYLHFVVTHQGQPDLIQEYPRLLLDRYVDGLLFVNTSGGTELHQCRWYRSQDTRRLRVSPISFSTMIDRRCLRSSICINWDTARGVYARSAAYIRFAVALGEHHAHRARDRH